MISVSTGNLKGERKRERDKHNDTTRNRRTTIKKKERKEETYVYKYEADANLHVTIRRGRVVRGKARVTCPVVSSREILNDGTPHAHSLRTAQQLT